MSMRGVTSIRSVRSCFNSSRVSSISPLDDAPLPMQLSRIADDRYVEYVAHQSCIDESDIRLDAIVRHCIAQQPWDHYRNAEELANDLDAYLARRDLAARVPSALKRTASLFVATANSSRSPLASSASWRRLQSCRSFGCVRHVERKTLRNRLRLRPSYPGRRSA